MPDGIAQHQGLDRFHIRERFLECRPCIFRLFFLGDFKHFLEVIGIRLDGLDLVGWLFQPVTDFQRNPFCIADLKCLDALVGMVLSPS